jgi:glutathione synthase/RimK-type ligase-like ATP-grasp enzyme
LHWLVDFSRCPLVDLSCSFETGIMDDFICYGSKRVAINDIRSIYVRGIGAPEPEGIAKGSLGREENRSRYFESSYLLEILADILPVLVVNRPTASSSNFSKPYQQQIIETQGFKVPCTLVTTIPEEAWSFYEMCQGQVIYKSISYRRSIVKKMRSSDLERLEQVRYCPTQFQQYIPGVDIRVHTVGSQAFATEIISQATDYRYSSRDNCGVLMRSINLPSYIEEGCLRLANQLGLVCSGIDLRLSPNGEYYCFEVNTSPGFTFYQAKTGQKIGEALVDLLCQGSFEI